MEAENKIKSDNFIQLKKNESILRLGIKDENGKDTGNFLTFNLKDIELPIKYQKIIDEHNRNIKILKNQLMIIDKKTDKTGKKALSLKEEETLKTLVDFFKKEKDLYNGFLGENGVEKLLNGRKLSWDTFDEINELIEQYIMPKIEEKAGNIYDNIVKKYSANSKRDDVIE